VTDTHLVHPKPARPKLIATDLDGTLLHDDKSISDRTLDALNAASAAGIEVVFVTGRPARWMEIVEDVRVCSVAICANGAAVVDMRDGRRITDVHPLCPDRALRMVTALRAAVPGISFAVERTSGISYDPHYPPFQLDPAAVVAPAEKLLTLSPAFDGQPILKLLARHPELTPDEFLRRGREAAGEHGEFTRSGPAPLLEVSALGVSKASTLAALCARRGIRAEEVVAFGDMPNDLGMLAWAGRSYAMANADPAVLAATARHTAANEADGVAVVVERLLARPDSSWPDSS
jgi:Cof subfamily protein (haloacid dehalogenase superfamily)